MKYGRRKVFFARRRPLYRRKSIRRRYGTFRRYQGSRQGTVAYSHSSHYRPYSGGSGNHFVSRSRPVGRKYTSSKGRDFRGIVSSRAPEASVVNEYNVNRDYAFGKVHGDFHGPYNRPAFQHNSVRHSDVTDDYPVWTKFKDDAYKTVRGTLAAGVLGAAALSAFSE